MKNRKGTTERATGLEPATSSLGSWHSTTELRPRDRPESKAVGVEAEGEKAEDTEAVDTESDMSTAFSPTELHSLPSGSFTVRLFPR